jgi:uncharacterized membrane protein
MARGQNTKRSRQIIQSYEAKALRKRSWSTRATDVLASYFGTLEFLILNILFIILWAIANNGWLPFIPVFDPYPHVLLITLVSLEAIILTIIVLMSQNRQTQIDTLREELQLQVELIAEKEISKVLKLLNEIMKHEGVKIKDPELKEMLDAVDTSYIEKKLEAQIDQKQPSLTQAVTDTFKKSSKK